MPSSDIYNVKESPWEKKEEAPSKPKRRRRRSSETFDDVMNKDVSRTNRRRAKNSGLRRFRHLMKKPEYSKQFWATALAVGVGILLVLIIWDFFFRYPDHEPEYNGSDYEMTVE